MCLHIRNLHDEYLKVQKSYHSSSVNKFKIKLELPMPFWPKNINNKMEIEMSASFTWESERIMISEDMAFLQSMITERKASYSTMHRNNKNRLKRQMVIQNKVRSPKNTSEPSTSSATKSLVTVTEPESQSCWVWCFSVRHHTL